MNAMDMLTSMEPYCVDYRAAAPELQMSAKKLCWRYNQIPPDADEERAGILRELLGTCTPRTFIQPAFRCDYGFNIHFHGLSLVNYNCVFLDTSPINIGNAVFIAPGVCLACAGHALEPGQRTAGIQTSAPITLEDGVWIGANAVVCGGVTVGAGSVIGAGSVVTHDIPAGVLAAGSPCRVIRELGETDRVNPLVLDEKTGA